MVTGCLGEMINTSYRHSQCVQKFKKSSGSLEFIVTQSLIAT